MEDRMLTEKESIEVITSMINKTKHRLHIGNGNMFLLWGYLTVVVGMIVWALLLITRNPAVNWLWFLLPVVGGFASRKIIKKSENDSKVRYYTDRLSSEVWRIEWVSAILLAAMNFALTLFAGINAWNTMFQLALLILGILENVQGVIIREKSLVYGGWVGIIAGMVTMCCVSAHIPLYVYWYQPFFLAAYGCMTIIPGHILNAKARKQ